MKRVNSFLAVLLVVVFSVPAELAAQRYSGDLADSHVVSLDQLRTAVAAKSSQRAANIEEIQKMLRHDEVRKHVRALADLEKIGRAVPTLDDATLARLAGESRTVNDQIRAGGAVTWIVIAVAVVVTIIVFCTVVHENEGCVGG